MPKMSGHCYLQSTENPWSWIDRKEGEMPEATDITKRIDETLPERNETKTNVAIKGRGDISKNKDVFKK